MINTTERHPWPPFLPANARLLMLGTFPPKRERWSMEFYYPNKINDMWRVMGLVFYGNKDHFWDEGHKRFKLEHIQEFLVQKGIGLWDTGMAVRRLKDNASDKFLEIVESIDLGALLTDAPSICHVATTGEKATAVVAGIAGVALPAIGKCVACSVDGHDFSLWRMPSTSRAYPLSIDKKAALYELMLRAVGIL